MPPIPQQLVAAEGLITPRFDELRELWSNTARFQQITDSPDAAAAAEHVWGTEVPRQQLGPEVLGREWLQKMRPLVQTYYAPGGLDLRRTGDGGNGKLLTADLQTVYSINTPDEYEADAYNAERAFYNDLGVIFAEMFTLQGRAPYPDLSGITMVEPIFRAQESELEDKGDYLACILQFQIGGRSV